ncbi:hypothetical protein NE865_01545 [Phthorimaea operculella]|nr:hypothetical protein NE865_01545 [Phthorimaea operculella]
MAAVNLGLCLVLVLYHVSAVFADEVSSESADLGQTDLKSSRGEGVRCYCNTAQCVSTGYMCRAPRGGGCYSELPRRPYHASHGCLNHLADTEEAALSRCQNTPVSGPPPTKEYSLLLCCFRDLCNHEDSPLAKARLNLTNSDSATTPDQAGSYRFPSSVLASSITPKEGRGSFVPVSGPPPTKEYSLLLCCFRDLCNHEDSPLARARLNLTNSDSALSRCQNTPVSGPPPTKEYSLLLCCFRDLCNHEDSPLARARLNLTNSDSGNSPHQRCGGAHALHILPYSPETRYRSVFADRYINNFQICPVGPVGPLVTTPDQAGSYPIPSSVSVVWPQHLSFLKREEAALSECQNTQVSGPPPTKEYSLLLCCFRDLCNHEDSPLARARLNLTNSDSGNTPHQREEAALSRCQNTPVSGPPPTKEYSLLLCCFRDLCNHEDSPLARARLNLTNSDSVGPLVTPLDQADSYPFPSSVSVNWPQHLSLLKREEAALSRCQNTPVSGPPPTKEYSLLLCCFRDLCNHEDSPLARARLNLTNSDSGNFTSAYRTSIIVTQREEAALSRCQNTPVSGPPPTKEYSLLLCCFRDLCNHEDSPLARARLNLTNSDSAYRTSDYSDSGNSPRQREEAALSRCQNTPVSGPPPTKEYSLLLCCFRDLCNHEDSPLARTRLNLTNSDSDNSPVATERGANYNGEVWLKAATIAVPVCGALILFVLVCVAVRLLKADALLQADRKLRGGYMSPLAQNSAECDVKKVWVGSNSAPLLVAPGGCLVAVERAQLVDMPLNKQFCDIR